MHCLRMIHSTSKILSTPALLREIKVLELFTLFTVFIVSKQNSHYFEKCINNTSQINQR